VTAQHREMLDQVLKLFKIEPDYDLNIMTSNQSPTQVAVAVLSKLEPIFEAERPDWVLVQGDTTTVMAASMAAFYHRVKVGHVEAGLRTYDKTQPFPEEINRRVASVIADLHFAPTTQTRRNLIRENIPAETVIVTGNPVIDAVQMVSKLPCSLDSGSLKDIPWEKRILLATAHRRENLGPPFESICEALREIACRFQRSVHIVYPVHLNPWIWKPAHRLLDNVPGITLIPPLDYLTLIHVLKQSYLVLTDSGGLQEEAPSLGKPILILRNATERPEGVSANIAKLVGTNYQKIVDTVSHLLNNTDAYDQMSRVVNPYGDGFAARHIVDALLTANAQSDSRLGRYQ
jgi:UDP-N-acetylglucosamine 2-epimerase (non-hydrolysing)